MAAAPYIPGVPVVVAHRTCPNHAPENSVEGIRKAAELGADAVEIDVRLTRDGRPILMHDRTLRRATGNPAPVWALAQNDLRRLRLANGEPVPTFGRALDALTPGLCMAVHVKVTRAIHPVLDEIRNQGAASRVWIWSEHASVIRFTADREPEIETSLLRPAVTRYGTRALVRAALRCGARGVGTYWRSVTPELAAALRERPLRFTSWCRTRDVDLDKLEQLDAIVSDWPTEARARVESMTGRGGTS